MVGSGRLWSLGGRSGPGSERGLDPGQRVCDRLALGPVQRPGERGLCRRRDPVVEAAELFDPFEQRRRGWIGR